MNKSDIMQKVQRDMCTDADGVFYWENFDMTRSRSELLPGSMPALQMYEHMVNKAKVDGEPVFGIEVGCMFGYSAVHTAKHMKKHHPDSKLICVDTWMGGAENFDKNTARRGDFESWAPDHGYPTMYFWFLTNVIVNDVQDIIVPLALPSTVAAQVLSPMLDHIGIKFDFAFVDGSHNELDVERDLYDYYPLLNRGGIVYGDDWTWDGVRTGVSKFASKISKEIGVHPNGVHWELER